MCYCAIFCTKRDKEVHSEWRPVLFRIWDQTSEQHFSQQSVIDNKRLTTVKRKESKQKERAMRFDTVGSLMEVLMLGRSMWWSVDGELASIELWTSQINSASMPTCPSPRKPVLYATWTRFSILSFFSPPIKNKTSIYQLASECALVLFALLEKNIVECQQIVDVTLK